MLKHYFAQFFRNLKRNKLFSLINILGLSAGICTSLLIYLYVDYHTSFDQFHDNGKNIYRVNQTFIWSDQVDEQFGSTGPGVMFAMSEALPEVKRATRLLKLNEYLVTYKNELGQQVSFMEPNVLAADSNFLDMFSFELLKGNIKDLLTNPKHIVLTETASQKYFGQQDPINKILTVEYAGKNHTYQVAGIMADIPDNSHLTFDMLMPMNSIPRVKAANWSWVWTGFVTFVELFPNSDIDQVKEKLKDVPRQYAEQTLQQVMNMSYEDYLNEGKQWNLYIQPLSDIHMNTNVINRINQPISASIVYAYGLSAAFIILLSCINFTNLTTTQHLKRAKSTGIKKILGSTRWQLSLGYMIESLIYCTISSLIGIVALWYILPLFSQLTGAPLTYVGLLDSKIFGLLIALVLGMTLIAGGYPALFLSAFKPLDAMKGKVKTGKESASLRNGLIIIQFTVSIILISSTLIAFKQLAYTQSKDVGFDKKNLLSVSHLEWLEPAQRESLTHEFSQILGVKATSICTSIPPNLWAGDQFEPVNAPIKSTPLNYTTADENYLPTLGLRLKYGRNFSKEFPDDVHSVIVNEEAIRIIGWDLDENVLGKKIAFGNDHNQFKIIGVVENFHFWDLWSSMDSFALFHLNSGMFDSGRNFAALSLHPNESKETSALLDQLIIKWKTFVPDRPFEYQFVDEAFAASFQEQQNFLKVLSLFSSLAILIACLGLIGIIIYAIEQRTKEIGIRKIVGASTWQLALLLSKQHAQLILASIILSIPLTIYMMQQWLQDFEYRTEISASVFMISGLAILGLTLSISAYHSVKAAMANPVDVLRDE
ncbi:ABC transporter permease [Reichenbachiella carrageenanivorans]|uniref:ABC transporter permease n=1 Tax=Reichenbachiella carrageenanivorans TaxID=2979869 RepID=A0ABY6D309_9BACT|nr:ABC transporter permease [Reichenbachiella carrageenanivorans]UXX80010.1 ABC transporter permease [Reichenbachiella carrageenanivorans]